MSRAWPVLHREREFDVVRSALTSSQRFGVVLTGGAGVGKSTLARAVTSTLRDEIRWVDCTESSRRIPLGAFAHVVDPMRFRDAVTVMSAARESLVARGPMVLAVDDAHLLDELSATLLHQLVVDRVVHLIATVRSGEPVPDAVTALWRNEHVAHLEVSPFTELQCVDLLESALGGRVEGLTAELIWRASGGNALFIRHLVEGSLNTGVLRRVDDVWQLRGKAGITAELVTLVESRIDSLPPGAIEAVRFLSLCEPLELDALVDLAGPEGVEAAEIQGLVQIFDEDGVLNTHFVHPLFGEVVRRKLGIAAARRLRGRIVDVLEGHPAESTSQQLRRVDLALDSDRPVNVTTLVAAAHSAMTLSDVALVERFAAEALKLGGGVAAADYLARALLWQGRSDEVEATLTDFHPDDLDEISLVRWGATRISNLYWSMADPLRGDDVLALLRARVTHPLLTLVVDGIASACELHSGRLPQAVEIARAVLAEESAPTWAVAWAAFAAQRGLALMGRGDEADAIANRVRDSKAASDGLLSYPAAFAEIQALVLTGRLADAETRAAQYAEFSSAGQYLAWGMTKTMVGYVEAARGALPQAVETLEQAVAALTSNPYATWSYPAQSALAQAYAVLGRTADAERVVATARRRTAGDELFLPPQLVAEAWVAAARGATTSAIAQAHTAARAAARAGQFAIEAEALHAAARFGDGSGARRLAELSTRLDGGLARLYARHAAAIAAKDGAVLDKCAAEFEEKGYLLCAADAAAQAAHLHDRRSDHRAKGFSAAVANRLAAVCGGALTPALRLAAAPLPLSKREREIADLVAGGLSNADIARQLVVSVRTVEGHVYRACNKLDVTDREQLAALVLGKPLPR